MNPTLEVAPRCRAMVWIASILALVGTTRASAQARLTVEEVAPRVRVVHGHPGGNVLVVTTAAGVLLVDAQSASVSDSLVSTLRGMGSDRVRLVVSTHYHEDHIGGNGVLRAAGATVLGHANLRARAVVDTTVDELEWHREAADPENLPTVEIRQDTTFMFGEVAVRVMPFTNAHTDGDLAVYLPRLNVLHTADVLEVDAFPFVDWWAGGSLDGMIAAVNRLLQLANDDTRIVPGHGRVVDRAHLAAYRDMLVTVKARILDAIAHGDDVQTAMGRGLAAEYQEGRGGERAARRFVGMLYLGLARDSD